MGYGSLIEFIRDLYGKPEGDIPLHAPLLKGNENNYLQKCIDNGNISTKGGFVEQFEDRLRERTGAVHVSAVVNGTSALHAALLAIGVGRGDLVITPALSFVNTANSVVYCGAEPIFLDVEKCSLGLDPQAVTHFLENETFIHNDCCCHIQSGKRIAACVPLHAFGLPCQIKKIVDICTEYGISVVENAAEALGSESDGRPCGLFGAVGTFSLNDNKIITSGGGGVVLTNDQKIGDKIRQLTTSATKYASRYAHDHTSVGYNYRMPNINGALGCAQLEWLDDFLHQKREIAARYRDFFHHSSIEYINGTPGSHSNYWLNTIVTADRQERDELLAETNDAGISTRPAWIPLNRLPTYHKAVTGNLEQTDWLADRIVNLPSSVRV